MTIVVDASVAVKWVLPEDAAERALLLRQQAEELIAPTLIAAEIGSAMRKHVVAKRLSVSQALEGARAAIALIDRIVPEPELVHRALELSIELQHPIYDCFYLVLAERENCILMTADQVLVAKAKRCKIQIRSL